MTDRAQTTYPEFLRPATEGQFAGMHKVCDTGVNENEAMPFGRVVVFDTGGTTDRSVELPAATGGKVMGITGKTHFHEVTRPEPGVAQVTSLTVAGTPTDGTYSFLLDFDDTQERVLVEVVRAAGVPATNNDIAQAFRDAINGDNRINGKVQAAGATNVVTVTKQFAGSFVVSDVTAPAPGTLVAALTTSGEQDTIPQGDAANLGKKGEIWVRVEDAVTPTSEVHFRHTANSGVGTALGALRGSADGGNTDEITAGATWKSTAGAGELAKLEINFVA